MSVMLSPRVAQPSHQTLLNPASIHTSQLGLHCQLKTQTQAQIPSSPNYCFRPCRGKKEEEEEKIKSSVIELLMQ